MNVSNLHIAVLMGGPGAEREVSLRSGAAVASALESLGARVTKVDIAGTEVDLPAGIDLAYNMIHGTFGEDGDLQSLLDALGVPYTGEGAEGSRLAFDKILSKKSFDAAGVPTPRWQTVRPGERPTMTPPFVVKAPRQGSSVGVHIVTTPDQLDSAIEDCFRFGDEVLVEDFVRGRELTVGVLGDVALPVVEIVPNEGFYDYEHKYTKGASQYHVPAPLGEETTRSVQSVALAACRSLGLSVYSRVDVLVDHADRAVVLEINTIPGMTETSLLPKAAAAVGIGFPDLCAQIAGLSLRRLALK